MARRTSVWRRANATIALRMESRNWGPAAQSDTERGTSPLDCARRMVRTSLLPTKPDFLTRGWAVGTLMVHAHYPVRIGAPGTFHEACVADRRRRFAPGDRAGGNRHAGSGHRDRSRARGLLDVDDQPCRRLVLRSVPFGLGRYGGASRDSRDRAGPGTPCDGWALGKCPEPASGHDERIPPASLAAE